MVKISCHTCHRPNRLADDSYSCKFRKGFFYPTSISKPCKEWAISKHDVQTHIDRSIKKAVEE